MELPRPWIPLDQDDELDEWTEDAVEQRIAALTAEIARTAEQLRAQTDRIATDVKAEELAQQIDRALADVGQDISPDVVQRTNLNRQRLDNLAISDWNEGAEVTEHLKRLHDETGYGHAWLSASDHLRGLEREALERLMNAIEQIKIATAQVTFLPQSVVVLTLPSGDEDVDLHYVREQTLKIGERLIEEKTEFTRRQHGAANSAKAEPNSALKTSFKVAQFAYYAGVLAKYAGEALKQVLTHFHFALAHFLPMLSEVAKSIA